MDRVSGWYKNHTQWMLFGIGVVLAIALNANTVKIVRELSRNTPLRDSVVAAAQSYQKSKTGEAANNGETGNTDDLKHQLGTLSKSISQVEGLGIPLGWPSPEASKLPKNVEGAERLMDWVERVWGQAKPIFEQPTTYVGWLLAAIAVSLGAPFWFDILNKFMVVRSTVKPGEKTQEGRHK
jgi:hypothetical protein